MAEQLIFELVSPEKLLLSKEATMVAVPGSEGDFGVLAGHAPMITGVRAGVIDVYEGDTVTDRVFVAGGFAEVTPERCIVLAEEAIPTKDINRADMEKRVKDLGEDLADAKTPQEREQVETRLAVAKAMLDYAA
ncbi:MAG: F0F1 ATP synthase subunit epsilon [Alphaproteobacteria bacterium]|nr:F0F1 ATP synthase subunit epsilon [Alphaproteobacteria bacterium]